MPEESLLLESRTVVSMAERLAIVETQLKSSKEDTTVIRSTIHDINNEMQRFVAIEMACQAALANLTAQVAELGRSFLPMGDAVKEFQRMHTDLVDIMRVYEQSRGVSAFGRRLAMVVGGGAALVGMIGGIAAGLVWLAQHLKPL